MFENENENAATNERLDEIATILLEQQQKEDEKEEAAKEEALQKEEEQQQKEEETQQREEETQQQQQQQADTQAETLQSIEEGVHNVSLVSATSCAFDGLLAGAILASILWGRFRND